MILMIVWIITDGVYMCIYSKLYIYIYTHTQCVIKRSNRKSSTSVKALESESQVDAMLNDDTAGGCRLG